MTIPETKITMPDSFRKAVTADIFTGNIIWYTDGLLVWSHVIDEVLRPNDRYKAFIAQDGCRYGLEDAFVAITEKRMSISGAIILKRNLRKDIKELVEKFEKETGLTVESIDMNVETVRSMSEKEHRRIIGISIPTDLGEI